MDNETPEEGVPDSPKPLAFTVDFGDGRSIDTQRHKTLVEKFQRKHRRGQSLSKLDETPQPTPKRHPLTGNLPRKASFQSEGYFSSDETAKHTKKRSELTLPLKNINSAAIDQMAASFSGPFDLTNIGVELKDVSSPELDLISPFSPRNENEAPDDVSDAGTYTLDADNYSEEQKERMSIDRDFKIELISQAQKTEAYVKSLVENKKAVRKQTKSEVSDRLVTSLGVLPTQKPKSYQHKLALSPILSPTQNISITQDVAADNPDQTFTKIMFPSPKARAGNGIGVRRDAGSVISVTSSGAFRAKNEQKVRKLSLTKSEVQVEEYVGDNSSTNVKKANSDKLGLVRASHHDFRVKLSANIVNVQSISIESDEMKQNGGGDMQNDVKTSNLPASIGSFSGKLSPSKIPSPIHTLCQPRSRNSMSSLNIDLSDSSLETESYLKPTQNCINALQKRLSADNSDPESEPNEVQLNNTILMKQRSTHTRHNSLDDKISNKLEHFQAKPPIDQTLLFNQYNNHQQNRFKIQNSPNNSPIRRSSSFSTKYQISPGCALAKNTNVLQETTRNMNSPNFVRNAAIQRSVSTANMGGVARARPKIDRTAFGDTESSSEEDFDKGAAKKKDLSNLTTTRYNRAFSLRRARLDEPTSNKCPNTPEMRRKFQAEHGYRAISMDRKPMIAKGSGNEIQSRYLASIATTTAAPKNRAGSGAVTGASHGGRNQVPSKGVGNVMVGRLSLGGPGVWGGSGGGNKPKEVFSRTDSGRFSMKAASKPPSVGGGGQKTGKSKDSSGKKSNGRSNSSLSSREKEFQMWKRRKSYDPMKAAAEGKKKELMAKKQNLMTSSCTENHNLGPNQDCDSSPSHSSSVHRSQSFHGTAALEQLISSDEDDDLTLSADEEGFSPPTPSPCELSPTRASLRNAWRDHHLH